MCDKCGYKNKSDSNFCNECGNNLQIQIVDNFLEYQSPKYNFKINYPATWTMRDKYMPNDDMKVIFVSPSENSGDTIFENLSITILNVPENYTLNNFIEGNIQNMKNENSDFVIIESLFTTIANLSAHKLVYSDNGDQSLWFVTKKGNNIYFLLYRAPQEKYLKFLSVIEQMIGSFQFIE